MTQVTQVTSGSNPSNATYFLQQSFLPGDRDILVITYEAGKPQIVEVSLDTGARRQLTSGPGIHPFSAAQHPGDQEIVYTRRDGLYAVHRATREERTIARAEGASVGECSISPDGEWLTAAFRRGEERGLLVAAWDGSEVRTIAYFLENTVFLLIGLQAEWILQDVKEGGTSAGRVVAVCLLTLLVAVVLRMVWVFFARYLLIRPSADPTTVR